MSVHARIAELYRELAAHHDRLARAAGDGFVDQHQSPLGVRLHCRLIRSGAIPGYRAGRRLLARLADVEAWLERHRVEPTEPAVGTEDADEALLAQLGRSTTPATRARRPRAA